MPHTRSHGPADGGGSESAGNFPARPADDQTQQSAASLIEDNQGEMDVPIDLQDLKIVQLRAVVARAMAGRPNRLGGYSQLDGAPGPPPQHEPPRPHHAL